MQWTESTLKNAQDQEPWGKMQIKTTRRCHFTPVRMAIIKETKTTRAGKDVQEREPFLAQCGWEHMNAPILPEGMEIPLKILSLFVAVLFIAQNGDHLSARLLVNTHTCAAYTQDDFFSHLKGWNPIIDNDMGGTEDHCSKLNKSGW